MRHPTSKTRGFTIAELLIAMALMGLLLSAIAYGMYSAETTSDYNIRKAELVTRARGVLDRIAADTWRADATLVSEDRTAVNIMFARRLPGGGQETVWRQYRKEQVGGEAVIKVYEDDSPIAFPPATPLSSATGAVLTPNVKTFDVWSEVTSPRTITETLSCQITATCGPNAGNTFTLPMEEGPYVMKLSQTQYDERPPQECVDYLPRPEYEPDDNPNVYWLCMEDAQAPPRCAPGRRLGPQRLHAQGHRGARPGRDGSPLGYRRLRPRRHGTRRRTPLRRPRRHTHLHLRALLCG